MANNRRKLGVNIYTSMQHAGISCKDFAEKLNYSYRDMRKIIEGRLMLPPAEIKKIADALNMKKSDLLHCENERVVPELQYMKEFSDPDNLDIILDILDDYVEIKETM